MPTQARSIEDTILGEAVHGTLQARYADMLGIASVISNRATLGNVSPEDVISAPGEFAAYGKSLPKGAEQYRGLAKQAWGQVQTIGPVTAATYYSTPSAAKNLPSGLKQVDQTTGHVYHIDPKNRAFRTAKGTVQPAADLVANVAQKASQTARAIASGAVNAVGSAGKGMAALAPNGLIDNIGRAIDTVTGRPSREFPDIPTPNRAPAPTARPTDYTPHSNLSGINTISGLLDNRGKQQTLEGITVHHTGGPAAGSPSSVINTLNERGFGAHYVVDERGVPHQIAAPGTNVAHMRPSGLGLNNTNTLGIEVMGFNDQAINPDQVRGTLDLIDKITAEHPSIGTNVYGHGTLNSHKQATEGQKIADAYKAEISRLDNEALEHGLGLNNAPTAADLAGAYGQMGTDMASVGVKGVGGSVAPGYSAPVGAVARGALGPAAPGPSGITDNMLSGMESPMYGPGQIAPSSPARQSAPSTFGNMVAGMDSPVYGPGQVAPASQQAQISRNPFDVQKSAPAAAPSAPQTPGPAELANAYGQMATMGQVGIANLSGAPLAAPQKPSLEQVAALSLPSTPAPALPEPRTIKTQTIAPPQKQAQPQQAPQQTIGAFPEAPEPYSAPKSKVGQRVTGALLGGLLGGLPGAAIGGLLGPSAMNSMKGNPLGGIGNAFGGLFGGTPNPGRFSYGSGVNAISDILGGGGTAGATAYSRSTPGYSVTNLGNGMVAKTNQYGVTSYDYTGPTTSLFGGKGGGGSFGSGRDASRSEADRGGRGVSAGGKGLW